MQTTNINIRTDRELKENCERLFESLGLNMSTAINIFLRQSLRVGGLPFEVKLDGPIENTPTSNGKEIKKQLSEENKAGETESLNIYDISVGDIPFRIALTKRAAGKNTVIHCSDVGVTVEEKITVALWALADEKTVICKPAELMSKERRTLLVISGTPGMICGLDEGIIASAKRYAAEQSSKFLYVMSEKAFDKLVL